MAITLLKTTGNLILTKRITGFDDRSKISGYDTAKNFTAAVSEISDIDDLANVLDALRNEPQVCVIHGVPKHNREITTRTVCRDGVGDIEDSETNWVMFDFDKIPHPWGRECIDDAADAYVELLPEAFHDVSCYASYSSSAGVNPSNWCEASVHLWFVIEPVKTSELFQWGKRLAEQNKKNYGARVIDYSVMNIVQPNFTADPIFEGVHDPISKRSVVIRKCRGIATLPQIDYAKPEKVSKAFGEEISTVRDYGDLDARLNAKLDQISGGAGECYYNMYGALMWYICSCHGRGNDPDKDFIVKKVSDRVMLFRPEYVGRISSEFDKAYSKCPYPKKLDYDISRERERFVVRKRQSEMAELKQKLSDLKNRQIKEDEA